MFCGIKYIYLLLSNIKNTYILRNIVYEIDIFDIHNFLILIITISRIEMIKNDYLLNV